MDRARFCPRLSPALTGTGIRAGGSVSSPLELALKRLLITLNKESMECVHARWSESTDTTLTAVPRFPKDHSPDEVVSDRWMNALQMVLISVRRPREAKGGVVKAFQRSEGGQLGGNGGRSWGVRRNHLRLLATSPVRSPSGRDQGARGLSWSLRPSTSTKRSSGAPIFAQKPIEIPRNPQCDGPGHRSLRSRVFLCLADLFGKFLQIKIRIWTSRDEYTFILVLRAASLPASWQRREILTMALAPFGCQRYSDPELLTRFRFHVIY